MLVALDDRVGLQDDLFRIEGADKVLNVGVNKVRFVSPAPSGVCVRQRQTVAVAA